MSTSIMSSLEAELKHYASIGDVYSVASIIEQVNEFKKFNTLYFFEPYQYQREFMNASKHYRQRYARSGNRTGKTKGSSYEMAYHLTGLYPEWYEGDRITDSGHTFWCIGIDLDSTSKVLQKELFGTADIRVEAEIGTGSIPKSHILEEGMTKDGGRIVACRILHIDGGYNTLYFYAASNGQSKLMGQAVKFIWMDEIPEHNAMAIYSQCLTRTATTDGHLMLTATPEAGYDEVNRLYAEDKTGKLYLQSISMYDAPHLTSDIIDSLKAGWPEYQWEMRIKGLPILGSGAVFPATDESIMCEDFIPDDYDTIIAALDFSSVNDASVVAWASHNAADDTYYIFHVDYITKMENKNEEYQAQLILNSQFPNIPTVSPHDGGINSPSPEAKAKVMKRMGVNVLGQCFYNAPSLSLNFKNKASNAREPGLTEMRRLMKEGRLKVCRSVKSFFDEKAQLFYSPASGGGIKTVGKDDCIDACRYAIISLIANRGIPAGQCRNTYTDFNNGYNDSHLSTY